MTSTANKFASKKLVIYGRVFVIIVINVKYLKLRLAFDFKYINNILLITTGDDIKFK